MAKKQKKNRVGFIKQDIAELRTELSEHATTAFSVKNDLLKISSEVPQRSVAIAIESLAMKLLSAAQGVDTVTIALGRVGERQ